MLDTDIYSFVVKRANEKLLKRLRRTPVEDVCISVITKAELLYGVDISPRPKAGGNSTSKRARDSCGCWRARKRHAF